MIRRLVTFSMAAALFAAAACSKPAAAPAAPAHPNLSGSWVRPLGERKLQENQRNAENIILPVKEREN
jgi:hypothetical protein